MSSSFVKIANKDSHDQISARQFDERETVDQYRQEIARLKDIATHQEKKIAYLYAKLTNLADVEAREKTCTAKEKKIAATLAKFARVKSRLMQARVQPELADQRSRIDEYQYEDMGKSYREEVNEKGGSKKHLDNRQKPSGPSEKKMPNSIEETSRVQVLTDSLQEAWQRIKELENHLQSRMKIETDKDIQPDRPQDNKEAKEKKYSQLQPLGYTKTANQCDIYLRSEPINFKQKPQVQANEKKLDNLSKDFSSLRHYLQKVSRTIKHTAVPSALKN